MQTIQNFKTPEVLNNITPQSVFLDYATGDFYQFDKYETQWKPKGNVGIHYSNALEVSKTMPGSALVSKP